MGKKKYPDMWVSLSKRSVQPSSYEIREEAEDRFMLTIVGPAPAYDVMNYWKETLLQAKQAAARYAAGLPQERAN